MSVLFAGYAALFGIRDGGGDTIRKGAFARALAESTRYPLFWQHNPAQPIGRVEAIAEDARGLRVIARLDSNDSRASDLLLRGEVSGLSFGYRARGYTTTATCGSTACCTGRRQACCPPRSAARPISAPTASTCRVR